MNVTEGKKREGAETLSTPSSLSHKSILLWLSHPYGFFCVLELNGSVIRDTY